MQYINQASQRSLDRTNDAPEHNIARRQFRKYDNAIGINGLATEDTALDLEQFIGLNPGR